MSCFQALLRIKSFFKNEPKIKTDLALMYKRQFQQSIFYETCVSTLRYVGRDEGTGQMVEDEEDQPFGRKSTRKSGKGVGYYENSTLAIGNIGEHGGKHSGQGSIPSTLEYMSITQKQDLLKQLIEKSYVFIDLSDLFLGEDLETYEQLVKQEIFEGEESIVESILETSNRKGVKDRLKYFDSEALHLLNDYVGFCERMTHKLRPRQQPPASQSARDQFLSRLILQLKAKLQLSFPSDLFTSKYTELAKLITQFKLMTDIILCTIQLTEQITITPQNSHQYAENFFTQPNICTLVSVILFMDQNFLKAVFQRSLEGLKLCVGRMGEKLAAVQKAFVDKLKNDFFGVVGSTGIKAASTQDLFTYKSNLQKIIEGGHQIKFQYFRKSLRTLQTLTNQREPIKCLKIIYELNKTIQKQHTQFINSIILQQSEHESSLYTGQTIRSLSQEMRKSQKAKKYSYSRETQRMIIEFLLARKKDKLRFIVTNIMMAHFFVHPSQLRDKKGSCLAPFVDIVKSLGFGIQME